MNKFETKYGYFSENGKEYIIKTPKVPKPWVNVISNGNQGLVVSQTGGGFSWLEHSEFNRITRWHQDMIQDNWGKYLYIKNNETGEVWSPTWLPVKTELDSYEARYGTGYATFTSEYKGIKTKVTLFIPFEDDIEIWDVKFTNNSGKNADLSVFTYFEWVLGSSADFHREFHKCFIETDFNEKLNGFTATKRLWEIPLGDRGHWNIEYQFNGYFACSEKVADYDGDKESFIGQYGSVTLPESIKTGKLAKKTGKWNDSIASLKVDVKLSANETKRVGFYLGLIGKESTDYSIVEKYKNFEVVDNALKNVIAKWDEILGTMEISTPDEGMNLAVNHWFRYQAIAGRLWARTAYYQQSGAFGFRDQLQDSLVYLPIDPKLTEKQIKLHARHQMVDGTVLHWWHPISDTGLETKMTDDLLWLAFVISHYIEETGNYDFLNEKEPFYNDKEQYATLYDHCVRAIKCVLGRFSERGLPLIGAGDWNDGLSAVGLEMKGESIWLAEFLYLVMKRFKPIAEKKNDTEFIEELEMRSAKLKEAFDEHAWDGEWYWRATKDSGIKIGSNECEEGKIFVNAQTWSVMSGIAPEDKQKQAMESVSKYLLKNNGTLLLWPTYTKPDKYIGYLTRYAPSRRENGGVYTHAATWSVWAYALLKDAKNTYEAYKRLNPIYSGMDPDKYVAEPYVTPGNIEGDGSPYYGMAGWTWYTGSASWFQKVTVDYLLGVRATENGLLVDPCIPAEWEGFKVKRQYRGAIYNIEVVNPSKVSYGIKSVEVNGKPVEGNVLPILEEGTDNIVKVVLG